MLSWLIKLLQYVGIWKIFDLYRNWSLRRQGRKDQRLDDLEDHNERVRRANKIAADGGDLPDDWLRRRKRDK